MSRYATVETFIWRDEKLRNLPEDARFLFLYLLTSPHGNMVGLFYLPKLYACSDLQWEQERYQGSIDTLCDTLLIEVDGDVVWLKNYLKFNPIGGVKQIIGAAKKLMDVPNNNLIGSFMKNLEKRLDDNDFKLFKETYAKPYRYPTNTLCDTPSITESVTGTVTGTVTEPVTGDKDICASDDARNSSPSKPGGSVEADEVTAAPGIKSGPRSPFRSKRQEQLFDQFWEQHPKKRNKGHAEKAWVKICPDDDLFDAIMNGLVLARNSPDWQKDGGQYVPYPSTWLNAKGWEDDHLSARDGPILSKNVEKGIALVEKYRRMEEMG